MTHTSTEQPSALREAAWLRKWFGKDVERAAKELEYMHARVQELEAELVKEAARTAEQKLRADQMTQQHAMQAKMCAEAAGKLASQAQRVPLDVSKIAKIAESFEAVDHADSFWVEVCRAFESAFVAGITQEKQG